jgi:hypothetical protein
MERTKAGDIPKSSPERLAELAAMPDDQIDTSDIPERDATARQVVRDETGKPPKRLDRGIHS